MTRPLTIGRATRSDDRRWDEFVCQWTGSTIDYSSKYRALLRAILNEDPRAPGQERPDWSMVADDGAIRAVLPMIASEGPYGRIYNSMPYFGSNGGILATDRAAGERLRTMWIGLVKDAAAGCIVEGQLTDQMHEGIPYTHTDERIAHFTEIGGSTEHDLLDRFEKRAVGSIRKAERAGVTVKLRTGNARDLAWLRRTQAANMAVIGAEPKSSRFFRFLVELFEPGTDYDLYIASIDGQPVAGALLLYFNGIVEYFVPALEAEARDKQPLSALLIRAMSDAAANGHRLWNWGASQPNQTGVRLFKRQWASTERPFRYLVTVNDERLLDADPDELRAGYPNFYVRPFSLSKELTAA